MTEGQADGLANDANSSLESKGAPFLVIGTVSRSSRLEHSSARCESLCYDVRITPVRKRDDQYLGTLLMQYAMTTDLNAGCKRTGAKLNGAHIGADQAVWTCPKQPETPESLCLLARHL